VVWKPDYVSVVELRDYLGIADSIDDAQLGVWVTAASRAVDRKCNRQFGKVAAPVTRVYRRQPAYDPSTGMWLLEIDDLQDSTGVTVNGVALASSGATLLPDNAPADGVPWERLGFADYPTWTDPWSIAGPFGWTAVPAQVPGAVRLQGARWNARRRSPLGTAGSPDQGSEIRLLAKLDPDVATTLTGLSRRRRVG
jgi:hypothetical protein